MNLRYTWAALLLPLVLGACGGPETQPPEPAALVSTQAAATRRMQEVLEAYGTVEFALARAATLSVQVESRVRELLVVSGAEVRRGQPLLILVPSPATQLELDKARRDAGLAAYESARLQRLRGDGLATEAEVQSAVTAAATAEALRDSLAQRAGPGGLRTLVSPRDGIVDALTARPGDVLAVGAVAARVAAADALQVHLGIEPEDLPQVAIGQSVQLAALSPGAPTMTAKIDALDRRVDPQTRLAAALVNLPPEQTLLPGATLRAWITVATHPDAVVVPRAALLYAAEKPYLFVVEAGKARRREVQLGFQDGAWAEIAAGTHVGELVVVLGNAALEDGMAVRTQAPGMPPTPGPDSPGRAP